MEKDDFLKAVNSGDVATVRAMLARDPGLANARNDKERVASSARSS